MVKPLQYKPLMSSMLQKRDGDSIGTASNKAAQHVSVERTKARRRIASSKVLELELPGECVGTVRALQSAHNIGPSFHRSRQELSLT